MSDLNCPHCGKRPDDAINDAMDSLTIGDAFEQFSHCDHCEGEISVSVSKEAYVNRRGRGYSDTELNELRAARNAGGVPAGGAT